MSCAEPNDDAYARCRSHLLIVLMGDQFSAGALILREGGERRATMWQLAIEAAALDTAWRRRRSIMADVVAQHCILLE
jgi:hypothetical protein